MAGQSFANISATPAPFVLGGGQYGLVTTGTLGTAQLQVLADDGVTWVNAGAALTAGASTLTLSPGQYRLNLSGASGLYLSLRPIPPAS